MQHKLITMSRTALLALLAVVALSACKKEEAPKAAAAAVAVPTNGDPNAWQAYASDVVKKNMDGVTSAPFVYFLPQETDADFQAQYDAQAEKVSGDLTRGILEGNMLAFVSPASAKMGDLVIASFTDVPADSMKGVKVLFIGQQADNARVQPIVAKTGAKYVFVEAK
jgi:hypothetical protein